MISLILLKSMRVSLGRSTLNLIWEKPLKKLYLSSMRKLLCKVSSLDASINSSLLVQAKFSHYLTNLRRRNKRRKIQRMRRMTCNRTWKVCTVMRWLAQLEIQRSLWWCTLTSADCNKWFWTSSRMPSSLLTKVAQSLSSILFTRKMESLSVKCRLKTLAWESRERTKRNFSSCLDLFRALKMSTPEELDLD